MRRHLSLISLTLTFLAALPAAAAASSTQVVSFEAPRELMSWDMRDSTLDEIRAFGVTNVRQLVYWKDFAPNATSRSKPRNFDGANPDDYPSGTWDRLDALVAGARLRGMKVQLTLTGPVPKWATSTRRDYVTRPSVKEFRAWATAVGRRYGADVDTWSLWNEPNHFHFLMPQYRRGTPVSPGIYRSLYQAGVQGLKATAANRNDTFLLGETAPRGNSKVVFPLDFLRRTLCLNRSYHRVGRCAALDADGYAHHAYTTAKGPRFVAPNRDDVTLGVLSRLTRALDLAARAGMLPKRLPVYLTEFGIQSYPDRIQGVSLAKQAAYMAVAEHIAYVNPRVRLFSQYLMRDDKPRGNRYPGFESGLRTAAGRKKPAYDAFRLPLAVENYGRTDVLWGLVRPFRHATTVTIDVDPPGKGGFRRLKTLRTTATGVYALRAAHRAGQRYRVRWTSPSGQRFAGPAISAY